MPGSSCKCKSMTFTVLSKVPLKHKKEVADDLRSIFYAYSKDKAMEFFNDFKDKYRHNFPSAVKSLSNSIDSSLTFFNVFTGIKAFGFYKQPIKTSSEEWISLRTTNIIERLNKEFKRKRSSAKLTTKSMEILAGENSSYNLLAFISIKMIYSSACTKKHGFLAEEYVPGRTI